MSHSQSNLQIQLTAWCMRRTATSGVRRVAPVAAALATEVGEVRTENQDRVAIVRGRDKLGQPYAVAALADGIGGMREGAECAALALGCLLSTIATESQSTIDPRSWLLKGIQKANDEVHARQRGEGGSTIAVILATANGAIHWSSVGDSRVYHANGGKLTQLSIDDTIAGQLGRGHEVGFEQSKLIQFIGIGSPLEASVSEIDKSMGGSVFITTDGVHYLDSTPWFGQLIKHAFDPGLCVRRLVELSKWCGGLDNASVAMISLGSKLDEGMPLINGCFEVWDSFGELQVIVEPAQRFVNPQTKTPPVTAPIIQRPLVEGSTIAKDSAVKEEDSRPASKKRNRSSKKGKSIVVKSTAEKMEMDKQEVPQLVIEFPNKTT
ncbi:MAG: protein phosphatase 2C domain-containing protein [Burkholderiales bacterium]|nr:protein phosphatase 2C domain-containing protein [Burkholderiales bacterium]